MNPSTLHRFEEAIRTHGDVEAALGELDQDKTDPEKAADVEQRIRNAASLALLEEKQV